MILCADFGPGEDEVTFSRGKGHRKNTRGRRVFLVNYFVCVEVRKKFGIFSVAISHRLLKNRLDNDDYVIGESSPRGILQRAAFEQSSAKM